MLLVRGDLIRKYGEMLVILNRASRHDYVHGQGTDHPPILPAGSAPTPATTVSMWDRDTVLADKARISSSCTKFLDGPLWPRYRNCGRASRPLPVQESRAGVPARDSRPGCCAGAAARPSRHRQSAPSSGARWDELSWSHIQLMLRATSTSSLAAPAVAEATELLEREPRFRLDCAKLLAEASRGDRARHEGAVMRDRPQTTRAR